jgi:V/A-type H+-transporting ATPase subunit I
LVGASQIMIGFALNFINYALKGEYIDALTVSLPKMILYVGALYFLLKYALDFQSWLSGPIFYLTAALIFLFFGKPILILISRKGRFVPVLGERIFEGSELLLSLISNTMSYARILALLMAHWALLTATYAVSDLAFALPVIGQPVELLMIAGGNIAVMAFEGLIVFIHTLRLHFYEWFSKFYEGTGTAFQPFKYQEKYVEIKVSNLSKKR